MFANLFGIKSTTTQPHNPATPPLNAALPLTGASPIPEGTTLEQLRSEMVHLMAQENLNHHRMGQLYNYIVENELSEKAGYKNARDYFSQRLADLSQASLTTYGAVAKTFSATIARRFGVTCLALLLTYAEAVDLALNPEEPGNHPIEVPDDKGQVHTLPFSQCSVDQMRRALKRKRKPASTKPVPAEAEALALHYREAVKSRIPTGARIQVEVRNQKGKAVMDFKGIPVEQVSQLGVVLTGQLPALPPVEDGALG